MANTQREKVDFNKLARDAWVVHSIIQALVEALPEDAAGSPISTRFLLRHVCALQDALASELMEVES